MRTFSEIIDDVVVMTKSPNYLPQIVHTANGILRDLDSNHDSDWQLEEVSLNYQSPELETGAGVTKWKIPCDFRSIRAIKINKCTFLVKKRPGLGQKATSAYWYQSGEYIILNGCHSCVDIAYYKRQRSMLYYDPKMRLLRSYDQCDWQWRDNAAANNWQPYDGSTAQQLAIYQRHVNWIIADYSFALLTGTLSSMYNSLSDPRGPLKYQEYVAAKDVIQRSRDSHLSGEL